MASNHEDELAADEFEAGEQDMETNQGRTRPAPPESGNSSEDRPAKKMREILPVRAGFVTAASVASGNSGGEGENASQAVAVGVESSSVVAHSQAARGGASGHTTVKLEAVKVEPDDLDYTVIKRIIEKEFGTNIPQNAQQELRKETLKLSKRIESLQKTNLRIKKLNGEVVFIEEKGEVPHGTRSFGTTFETPLLDTLKLTEAERTFTFTVKQGATIREAMKACHIEHTKRMKQLELKVLHEQRKELKEFVRKSSFTSRMAAIQAPPPSNRKILDIDESDDELKPPVLAKEVVLGKAAAIYEKTVARAAEKAQKEETEATEAKNKRTEALTEIRKQAPSNLFEMAIDQRIEDKMKEAKMRKGASTAMIGKDERVNASALYIAASSSGGLVSGETAETCTEKAKQVQSPKNGTSPGRNGGRDKGKGRGKGKNSSANVKGKGKSKSKSKTSTTRPEHSPSPPSKGKGKGKSKSKGKGKMSAQTEGRGRSRGRSSGRGRGRGRPTSWR